jgi:hypothetical protein
MLKKEMTDDINLIHGILNLWAPRPPDSPLGLAISRIKRNIDSLHPGIFIDKEELFILIDRIFAHYESAILAYTDIISNYNEKCTIKMAEENVDNTKILLLKISDSLKSTINDYFKEKEF